MFCSHCGSKQGDGVGDGAKFCISCGKELLKSTVQPFGRASSTIKSFVDFKNGREGRPEKSELVGKKKKKTDKQEDAEVIISIGLMVWDPDEEVLKQKRGKRLPIKVNRDANYTTLLEKATSKWRDFNRNLYNEEAEYVLLLEDGQEAIFLPGSSREFFSLARYKEEVMRDFKRITLFLCTFDDFRRSTASCDDEEKSPNHEPDVPTPSKKHSNSNADENEPPSKQKKVADHNAPIQNSPGPSNLSTSNLSTSTASSWFYYDEIDRLYSIDEIDNPPLSNLVKPGSSSNPNPVPDCEVDVIKALEKKVIVDGKNSLYIVIRRGATLDRALTVWRRASAKVTADHVLRVKFIGEDGIDDGALAREFLASTVAEIGKKYFPEGNPMFSTNDIQNGNFKTIGEVIAVSLSQGGPPPSFLDPNVYDTLVSDVDLSSDNIEKYLTQTELDTLQQVKENVSDHMDLILEHGYTGVINNGNMDSIVAAIVVSMLGRRALVLKEFQKGLELFGLATTLKKYPEAARNLFVIGEQKEVDADYVFSLMKPEYSKDGTSRRQKEEQVMDFFQDFVYKLESESVTGYSEALAWKGVGVIEEDDDDGSTNANDGFNTPDMNPASVLGWLTGQRHRDLVEKKPIYVKFDHECLQRNPHHKICFPCVGACGREITFPVVHMATSDSFNDVFLIAFCKGQAFSRT